MFRKNRAKQSHRVSHRLTYEPLEDRHLLSGVSLLQTLNNPTPAANDKFGHSVAIDGTHMLVGTFSDDTGALDSGAAYLFDATSRTLLHTFTNPSPAADDRFGGSAEGNAVAVSGNLALVGASGDDTGASDAGSAYLFDATTGGLLKTFHNPAPAANGRFGWSVALSGNDVLISSLESLGSGSVRLYDATTGSLMQTFSNPLPSVDDRFGYKLAIDGNHVLVGSPLSDVGATNAGIAYLFDATTGGLVHTFTNPTPESSDFFGFSVAISGDDVVIGSMNDDVNGSDAGAAYVFDAITGNLVHAIGNPTPATGDQFGVSVAVSGNRIAVGASLDDAGTGNSGAVHLFDVGTGGLIQSITNPAPAPGAQFGWSVAMSGHRVLAGAIDDDTNANNAGTAYLLGNPPPTVVLAGASTVEEGSVYRLNLLTSDDEADTLTAVIDWGDGSTEVVYSDASAGSFDATHIYADNVFSPTVPYPINVTVADDKGNETMESLDLIVTNVVPTTVFVGDQSVAVGEVLSLTDVAVITDPGFNNSDNPNRKVVVGDQTILTSEKREFFNYQIFWGDGRSNGGEATIDVAGGPGIPTVASFDGNHVYAEIGQYTVEVVYHDDDMGGAVIEHSFTVDVFDPTPTISVDNQAVTIAEGNVANNSGSYTDAPGDVVTLNASIGNVTDLGDGTWKWSYESTDDLTETVTVTATDGGGASSSTSFELTINNVAPNADIKGETQLVPNEPAEFSISARDVSGDLASFDYVIDWKDGSPIQYISGPRNMTISHVYKATGDYSVKLTATDKDGGTSTSVSLTVSVQKTQLTASKKQVSKKTVKVGVTPKAELEESKVKVAKGSVEVFIDEDPAVVYTDPDIVEIIVYGHDGDDDIRIDPDLSLDGGATFLSAEIYGFGGNDILQGGSGDNLIVGGEGNDTLIGGAGTNTLDGGDGDDTVQDGGGNNTVIGGSGNNTFVPGGGDNTFEAEPGSTAPEVFADYYQTDEDALLSAISDIGVIANDLDPTGVGLTTTLISSTAHGVLTLGVDGSFTYTPDENFHGEDSFTYRATNSIGESREASVSIQVNNLVDLSGRVFDDRNNDGMFDDADIGLNGLTVELYAETDLTPIATEQTDADGRYTFDANLPAGVYRIVETPPTELLDAAETAGELGGSVDNTQDSNLISQIVVASGDLDADGYNFANIQPSRIQGLAWEDFNNDGEVNFGEKAIGDVTIALSGTDDRGNAVLEVMETDGQGIFEFIDLRPSNSDGYRLTETQPVGFVDGQESLGTVNGALSGVATDNVFSQIGMSNPGSDAMDYNFGELPEAGAAVQSGQTATIGYWQNKNGQALIKSLNAGANDTQLSDWLATTFPNMYGINAGSNQISGLKNVEVAQVYKSLFKRNREVSVDGPPKLDAQVMATAFAVYVTNETLASTTAVEYGFLVTEHGVGTATVNVGDNGAAFDVADHTELTILDILWKTDQKTRNGILYDLDGNDEIDEAEKMFRIFANEVYTAINEQGDI